jgi:hypothetical protein
LDEDHESTNTVGGAGLGIHEEAEDSDDQEKESKYD